MLEDPIQMPKTVTCGPFQIYFYENLFSRWKQQSAQLQKTNKQCYWDITQRAFHPRPRKKRTNDKRICTAKTYQHGMTTMTALDQSPILVYPKLVTLDRFSLCGEKNNKTTKTDETLFGKG